VGFIGKKIYIKCIQGFTLKYPQEELLPYKVQGFAKSVGPQVQFMTEKGNLKGMC
jgi:hypothetical protein